MQQNHGTMYAFEGELLMREQLRAGDFALHSFEADYQWQPAGAVEL
jgi:hypothetical protein